MVKENQELTKSHETNQDFMASVWRTINTSTCITTRRDSADVACHMCLAVLVTVKLASQGNCHTAMATLSGLFVAEEKTHTRQARGIKHYKQDAWSLNCSTYIYTQ